MSTSSISIVCRTAGNSCTRASVVLILPVLGVSGPSVLLVLPVLAVYRPPAPQYSQYSHYEWSILGASVHHHCNAVRKVECTSYYCVAEWSAVEVQKRQICNFAISIFHVASSYSSGAAYSGNNTSDGQRW